MEEYAALLEKKRDIYLLLAAFFAREPSAEFLGELNNSGIENYISAFSEPGEVQAQESFGTGDNSPLLPADELSDAVAEGLADEFCRIFLGPTGHLLPYESVQCTDGEGAGSFWGEKTAQVKLFMARFGLELNENDIRVPDHMSLEFEFMGRMLDKLLTFLREKERDQATIKNLENGMAEFLQSHISKWIPGFCQKLMDRDLSDFFLRMVGFTNNFILSEIEDTP
jgi:TorA maturation chaperone TorD